MPDTTPLPECPHKDCPATIAFGPQGREVAALVERARSLTAEERDSLAAVWPAAWTAAWDASWSAKRVAAWRSAMGSPDWDAAWWAAAWPTTWDASLVAAWTATRATLRALVVRDLISREHYDMLTIPWRTAIGSIHPDDEERP